MSLAVTFVLVVLALAPWAVLSLALVRTSKILALLLDHLSANREVGGEPTAIIERKLALQERDLAHRHRLEDLRAEQDRRNAAVAELTGLYGGIDATTDPLPVGAPPPDDRE